MKIEKLNLFSNRVEYKYAIKEVTQFHDRKKFKNLVKETLFYIFGIKTKIFILHVSNVSKINSYYLHKSRYKLPVAEHYLSRCDGINSSNMIHSS